VSGTSGVTGRVVVGVVETTPEELEDELESGRVVVGEVVPVVPPAPGLAILPLSPVPVPLFPPGIYPPSKAPVVKIETEAKLEL
jgi:hypothetical protein